MQNKKIVFLAMFAMIAVFFSGCGCKKNQNINETIIEDLSKENIDQMVWGATIRPFALKDTNSSYKDEDLEKQFKYLSDLFGDKACARANVETNMSLNDKIVEYSEEYNVDTYFVLEDHNVDFNDPSFDFESSAENFAKKFTSRYKGKVRYYQLANEITGTVYQAATDSGETINAGYGLKANKNRFDNVSKYVKAMAKEIRSSDPEAKIIISGHWVLDQPIIDLINDGLDVDIVGWNWGSGLSDEPGVKYIDENYGTVNLPKTFTDLGKEFWLVEANYDDGSMENKEQEQADYIELIASKSAKNSDITGYFHFILTESADKGKNLPMGYLGLVEINQDPSGEWSYGNVKPAYRVLKELINN